MRYYSRACSRAVGPRTLCAVTRRFLSLLHHAVHSMELAQLGLLACMQSLGVSFLFFMMQLAL